MVLFINRKGEKVIRMKMTRETRILLAQKGAATMRALFEAAVEPGREPFMIFLPDSKGDLRLSPFLDRAIDITLRTHSDAVYKLLSFMLCSIEELRRRLEVFADIRPRTFIFSQMESNIAVSKLERVVAEHYMIELFPRSFKGQECPEIVTMLVRALEHHWSTDVVVDEPLDEMALAHQAQLSDFFYLVAEMREVIVSLANMLGSVGAK